MVYVLEKTNTCTQGKIYWDKKDFPNISQFPKFLSRLATPETTPVHNFTRKFYQKSSPTLTVANKTYKKLWDHFIIIFPGLSEKKFFCPVPL